MPKPPVTASSGFVPDQVWDQPRSDGPISYSTLMTKNQLYSYMVWLDSANNGRTMVSMVSIGFDGPQIWRWKPQDHHGGTF